MGDFAFLIPLNTLCFRPTCLIIVTTTTKTSGATEVKGVTGGSGRLSWIFSQLFFHFFSLNQLFLNQFFLNQFFLNYFFSISSCSQLVFFFNQSFFLNLFVLIIFSQLVLLSLFPHLYNGNNEEVEICYSSELSKQVEEDEVEQSVF